MTATSQPDSSELLAGKAEQVSDTSLLSMFLSEECRIRELAFEELVQRYRELVIGVCRRTLGDAHEAEDAFQATFMILARKAKQIRDCESLGGWLHRVAYRLCLRIRSSRRQTNEWNMEWESLLVAESELQKAVQRDTCRAIDEEIDRLKPRFKEFVVLCSLQGKSYQQVARMLGVSRNQVKWGLSQARSKLKNRLAKRGLFLSVGLLASLEPQLSARNRVSASTLQRTTELSLGYADGSLPDYASNQSIAIANQGLQMIYLTNLKGIALVCVAVLALGVGTVGAAHPTTWAFRQFTNEGQPSASSNLQGGTLSEQPLIASNSAAGLFAQEDEAAELVKAKQKLAALQLVLEQIKGSRDDAQLEAELARIQELIQESPDSFKGGSSAFRDEYLDLLTQQLTRLDPSGQQQEHSSLEMLQDLLGGDVAQESAKNEDNEFGRLALLERQQIDRALVQQYAEKLAAEAQVDQAEMLEVQRLLAALALAGANFEESDSPGAQNSSKSWEQDWSELILSIEDRRELANIRNEMLKTQREWERAKAFQEEALAKIQAELQKLDPRNPSQAQEKLEEKILEQKWREQPDELDKLREMRMLDRLRVVHEQKLIQEAMAQAQQELATIQREQQVPSQQVQDEAAARQLELEQKAQEALNQKSQLEEQAESLRAKLEATIALQAEHAAATNAEKEALEAMQSSLELQNAQRDALVQAQQERVAAQSAKILASQQAQEATVAQQLALKTQAQEMLNQMGLLEQQSEELKQQSLLAAAQQAQQAAAMIAQKDALEAMQDELELKNSQLMAKLAEQSEKLVATQHQLQEAKVQIEALKAMLNEIKQKPDQE